MWLRTEASNVMSDFVGNYLYSGPLSTDLPVHPAEKIDIDGKYFSPVRDGRKCIVLIRGNQDGKIGLECQLLANSLDNLGHARSVVR